MCNSTGQHASERVAEHRERLIAYSGTNFSLDRQHDVFRARYVSGRTLPVPRKIEIQTLPSADALDHRVQRQQQPMINSETVQQYQGEARSSLDNMHAAKIAGWQWSQQRREGSYSWT